MAQVDVLEAQWGMFYPPAMIAADTTNTLTNKIARDRFLSMMFLQGADKKRFENLRYDLHNSKISDVDKYPKTIESMYTLLMNYQDHGLSGGKSLKKGRKSPECRNKETTPHEKWWEMSHFVAFVWLVQQLLCCLIFLLTESNLRIG